MLTLLACMLHVLSAGQLIPNEYIVIFESGADVTAATARWAAQDFTKELLLVLVELLL
jgi:hypothetical protein